MNNITKIVMISAKQGSGKTTLADGLASISKKHGYLSYRTRFAKVLYAIHDAAAEVAVSYGIPWPKKHSLFLQLVGTECSRNFFGENVWVDALKEDVRQATNYSGSHIVIIDDMRFRNEFHAYEGAEVYKIRLEAPKEIRKARTDAWRDNDTHPSEVSLDDYINNFDLVLDTHELNREQVLNIVEEFVFLKKGQ